MTAQAALYWLLTAIAGGLVAALVRVPLAVEERAAIAVVTGMLGGALAALGLATAFGMRTITVLAGPALLAVVAYAALRVLPRTAPDNHAPGWRQSLAEVRARWDSHELMWIAGVTLAAVIGFSILFSHTLFTQDGAIQSNFATVWADWSMHSTTANSFALGHNLPPSNPVFSNTTLLYPFLPDFQSGMLLTLGNGIAGALAIPGAVVCVAITLLVLSLARRLSGSLAVGVVAMAMCMLGGGLGVEQLYWDACHRGTTTLAQCAPSRFASDPAGAAGTAVHTVANLPHAIATQRHPYDALQPQPGEAPLSNLQWNTPLLAWWLPQRPFLFGFASVLCILLVVVATRGDPRPQWAAFAVAGLLAGMLPLVHVHSFIALVLVLPVLALIWRRNEWALLGVLAVVLATPRLVQLAHGDHGAAALGNTYPWIEPGWMSQVAPATTALHQGIHPASVAGGVRDGLRALVTPEWWGFWFVNCGIVLPLMALFGVATLSRLAPAASRLHRAGRGITGAVPDDVLRLTLPFLLIFAICNLVVFQSWDWDNTKLFAYWYFAAALLVASLVVHWWRSGWWRATLGTLAFLSVIMTGTVVMLRFMPWTPAADSNAGPFVWESADDRALAAQVAARTAPNAVILTLGRHNDAITTLAGRSTYVGYAGWLWSYGIDYRARQGDVQVMYQGCATGQSSCPATQLMQLDGISYVEISASEYLRAFPQGNLQWWSSTFPAVAQVGEDTVYDVRAAR